MARTGISAQSAHKRGDQHGSDKEYGSKCLRTADNKFSRQEETADIGADPVRLQTVHQDHQKEQLNNRGIAERSIQHGSHRCITGGADHKDTENAGPDRVDCRPQIERSDENAEDLFTYWVILGM